MSEEPPIPPTKTDVIPMPVEGEGETLKGEVVKPVEPVITVEDGVCFIIAPNPVDH